MISFREWLDEHNKLNEKVEYDYKIKNDISNYKEKDVIRLLGLHISEQYWLEDKNINFLGIKCNTKELPKGIFDKISTAIGTGGVFRNYLSSYTNTWNFFKDNKLAKGSKNDAYISGELYKWFAEQKLNIQDSVIELNEPKKKKASSDISIPEEFKKYIDEKGKLTVNDSYNFAKTYNYEISKNIDDTTMTALMLYAYKNNFTNISELLSDFKVKKLKTGKIIIKNKAIVALDNEKIKIFDYHTPDAVYDGAGKISSNFSTSMLYDIFSSEKDLPKTYLKLIKLNDIYKYSLTEHEFMKILFNKLENSKEGYLKKGEIDFGMGDTRRKRYDNLVSSGYIEEIQQGSTKFVYLSGTSKENLTKKTLNKLVYVEIKNSLNHLTGMRRYAYVYGINADENDITIAYRLALTGMRDKDSNGTPTTEYDNKVSNDANEIIEEVNKLKNKYPEYNIKVKQISIFDDFKSNI